MLKFSIKFSILALLIFGTDILLAGFFRSGLDRYYGLDKKADIFCIGNSRSDWGIDGTELELRTNKKVAKYVVGGLNVFDRQAMISYFLRSHEGEVKVVVYDVDHFLFNYSGLGANQYMMFYPFIDDAGMAHYVRKSAGSWSEYAIRKTIRLLRFSDNKAQALRGHMGFVRKQSESKFDVSILKRDIAIDKKEGKNRYKISINPSAVRQFEETIKYVRGEKVVMVLLYLPNADILNGIEPSSHDLVMKIIKKHADKDEGVIFVGAGESLENNYDLFFDPTHLNNAGQKLVTDELSKELQKLFASNEAVIHLNRFQ